MYCIAHIYILTYRQSYNAIKKSDRPIRIFKITLFDKSALSKPFEIAKIRRYKLCLKNSFVYKFKNCVEESDSVGKTLV